MKTKNLIISIIITIIIMFITFQIRLNEECGLKSGCTYYKGLPFRFYMKIGDVAKPIINSNLLLVDIIIWFVIVFILLLTINKLRLFKSKNINRR